MKSAAGLNCDVSGKHGIRISREIGLEIIRELTTTGAFARN